MSNRWKWVSLGDVCKTTSGGTPSRSNQSNYAGNIPWIKSGELNDTVIFHAEESISEAALNSSSAKIIPSGTLLIALYGATVGKLGILRIAAATNQAVCAIITGPDIDRDFLFYYLLSQRGNLISKSVGGAQPNISQAILGDFQTPVPPLDEQRRIAAILSRADRVRRLARFALELGEGYLQSVFLEMFGDPVTNPKGWKMAGLADLGTLDRGRSKHRPRNAPELYGGPYPFIQTGDIANADGYVTEHQQTYNDRGLAQSKMWLAGTLCITIAANIAKTAVLTFDACFPDSVVGFAPGEETNTEFIRTWFSLIQPRLEETAPESAQKNINLEILRALELPLPLIDVQNQFAAVVHQFEHVRSQQREQLRQAEHLFTSLLDRAFSEGL